MKKIAFFCRDQEGLESIEYLVDNINSVLGDYVKTSVYFLNEMEENQQVQADAYLVLYEEMLRYLVSHISDFSKVIVITRSIQKKNLQSVMNIPSGTDVLVINDSRESILQTIHLIYELGIGHIKLHPYDETLLHSDLYRRMDTCIVANGSEQLIPSWIIHIHNIYNREISFETFQKLITLLELENPVVRGNLFNKITEELDTGANFIHSYLGNFLKEQLLTNVIETMTQAIVLLDKQQNIHYINEKGYSIFHMITGDNLAKSPLFFNALVEGDDYKDELVRFSEQNYLVEKHSFILQNKEIGCCLILQNEKDLRDTEGQLNRQLKTRGLYAKYTFRDITCQSMSMKKSIDIAKRAALSDYTILIRGESGTGKELFAQSIHNYSLRKKAPFVAVNCAALPENLLESELFGYEPGAFTGAQKNGKIGLFEQAEKGTIFLDEIGDISPNLQSRLLRVIQEKQVMRIGSDKIIDINVRIIAATNANLEKQIACGKFRSDLFYRLNVLSIHIAPLRQRREDILPLLQNFLGKYYKDISPKERDILYRYDWPGNVRELENVAFYYRTLDTVPEYLQHPNQNQEQDQFQTSGLLVSTESVPEPTPVSRVPDSAPCSEEEIKKLILRLIADATKSLSGIGRTALLQKLALHNVQIGEGKLKRLLSECQNDGLIKVYQGRSGSQITPKGQAYLS